MLSITRRSLLAAVPLAGIAAVESASATQSQPAAGGIDDTYPSHSRELARDMVGASHGRIERVRELLAERPELAKAAWDWGFGDWETALGAASHTGQREIAELLISHGARPDLFTFAMLGQLDVVRACVTAQPGIQRLHGPHGITLLKHALAGGDAAAAVASYLSELGDADNRYATEPLSTADQDRLIGEYRHGPGSDDTFAISRNRTDDLTIRRGAQGARINLFHTGKFTFHPAGAHRVAIRFDVPDEGAARGLTIDDGTLHLLVPRVA